MSALAPGRLAANVHWPCVPRARSAPPALGIAELIEVRAALAAGAAPGQALAAVEAGVLGPAARAVRLGRPLLEEARTIATGDPAADLLVRALGVAERAGVGGDRAVDQALTAVRDAAALARLVRVRTAQARGTATVLTLVPVVAWILLVALDGQALGFYTTPLGLASGTMAVVLALLARWWTRRAVRRASLAAAHADPLTPAPAAPDLTRLLALGVPALAIAGIGVDPIVGVLAAAIVIGLAARPRRSFAGPPAGAGAAEAVELVAVALSAGLPSAEAVAAAAEVTPAPGGAVLAAGARRLRGGWAPAAAFAGTGLEALGDVLGATGRWGAPAAEALRALAADLRAQRRMAAEEAAERVQLTLVFPTTLLTVPAFVLAVVPPLLWTAFSGGGPSA